MLFLAFKQLFARPQQTLLTFLAILIGTGGYVVFSGIMLGFQEYFIDRLINSDAQIRISARDEIISAETFRGVFFPEAVVRWIRPPGGKTDATRLTNAQGWFEKLDADPDVIAYSPQLVRQAIVVNGKNSRATRLLGLDPARQKLVTNIEQFMVQGSLDELGRGDALIVLGEGLMRRLGAQLGDTISVLGESRTLLPARIVGVYRSGSRLADEGTAFSSIRGVQKFTSSTGEISDIAVRIRAVDRAAEIATRWAQFSTDKVESWDQANESFLSVFRTQDIMRNAITAVIILIVSFGIYNILNMVVSHKKRDIAILRSMGYGSSDIGRLFLMQGVLLGILGACLGLIVGYFACTRIALIELGQPPGGGEPMRMRMSYNLLIYMRAFGITVTASIIASYLPARMASRLSPIEIIRGES